MLAKKSPAGAGLSIIHRLLKMQLKWHWLRVGVVYEFKALPTLPVWQPAVIQAVTPINLGNLMRS